MKTISLALILFSTLWWEVHLLPDITGQFDDSTNAQIWAVLVAGSDSWFNYRHQADICHAYQVLHNHGIPDDRIIVMMKDDIANNSENPTPGIVINHPNGDDVYKGVPHDYTGEEVTPENFMAVLKGDKQALSGVGSGKVLESGPNDNVFVYFSDHGAPGLIAFPDSELTAKQLNKTIRYMNQHKKYKQMVIYIEACESGSMFKNILPNNINIYATTAANAVESSYACYYDDKRETYLGDVYSVNWMEDSDKENLSKETLEKQFKIVKKETNTSHVQEFGDLDIGKLPVGLFQGKKKSYPIVRPKVNKKAVRNRDAYIHIVKNKIKHSSDEHEKSKLLETLRQMHKNRNYLATKVKHIAKTLVGGQTFSEVWKKKSELQDFECYDEARQYFQERCFKISKNHYALEYMYVLVNLCEKGVDAKMQKIAMEKVCTHPTVEGIN